MKRKETRLIVENWRRLLKEGFEGGNEYRKRVLLGEWKEFHEHFKSISGGDYDDSNYEDFFDDDYLTGFVYENLSREFYNVYIEIVWPEDVEVETEEEMKSLHDLKKLFFDSLKAGDPKILGGDMSIMGAKKFYTYSRNDLESIGLGSLFERDAKQMQYDTFKPVGIWFGMGDEWRRFCEENNYNLDSEYKYKFLISLDLSKICVVDSNEMRRDFEVKYKVGRGRMATIDWGSVTEDYDGVIITEEAIVPTGHWTSSWDITSGCVWRASGIKGFDREVMDLR